jgi:ABC-type multidrug transport system fused ATPase/permease subunit
MLITELSSLTQPFLLGKTIDGLIGGSWFWLVFLGLSYLVSNFFTYKRMVYDTKVYTKIYNDIVFKFLKNPDIDNSTKIARTEMAHDIVHVLEDYVHYYISIIVTIIGTAFFIYSENWIVGLLVSVALIFILIPMLYFYKKINQSNYLINDHAENKVKSIESGYDSSVSFFNRRRKLNIFDSTIQGKSWFSVELIISFFLLLSILILITTSESVTVGGVVMMYSYVSNFLSSLLSIPVAMDMYSRLSDILKRIN